MSERNGPGGMKTERRSPIMKSGVATPSVASNNIAVVIRTAARNPASNPARMAFVLRMPASRGCRSACAKHLTVRRSPRRAPLQQTRFCRCENLVRARHDHLGRDLLHAGVIKRTLAQATVIAG